MTGRNILHLLFGLALLCLVRSQGCNEQNVATKYLYCLRFESRLLTEQTWRTYQYCMNLYRSGAHCVDNLGKVCGSGKNANRMRFYFDRKRLMAGGHHICSNLDSIRKVSRCMNLKDKIAYMQCLKNVVGKQASLCQESNLINCCLIQNMKTSCPTEVVNAQKKLRQILYNPKCKAADGKSWSVELCPGNKNKNSECNEQNVVAKHMYCLRLEAPLLTEQTSRTYQYCMNVYRSEAHCVDNLDKVCGSGQKANKMRFYYDRKRLMAGGHHICYNLDSIRKASRCMNSKDKTAYKQCLKNVVGKQTSLCQESNLINCCVVQNMKASCPNEVVNAQKKLRQILYNPKCKTADGKSWSVERCPDSGGSMLALSFIVLAMAAICNLGFL